jgi:hypothetical protein
MRSAIKSSSLHKGLNLSPWSRRLQITESKTRINADLVKPLVKKIKLLSLLQFHLEVR